MKRAIYPLYAPADESRVRPILDALREKGVTVRQGSPGKEDALVLFLSENLDGEGPEADTFFRLNAGRALVIPVNLDGSTPPEVLQNALMARHGLDGTKYGPQELAERIAKAVEQKSRLPLVLTLLGVLALLVVGGVILWKQRPQPEPTAPVVEVTAEPTLEPTPAPTEDPRIPGIEVDLESIAELAIAGDRMVYYTWDQGYNQYKDNDFRSTEGFAYGVWQEDGAHFYSADDGHEFPRAAWDLNFLQRLPNLKYLTLCIVDGVLPDLSGLEKLMGITLQYCEMPDLVGLRRSSIRWIEYHGGSVTDFSPLSDCLALKSVDLDLVGSRTADFSGFCPKKLSTLHIVNGHDLSDLDMTGLMSCSTLQELTLEHLPMDSLTFLTNAHRLTDLFITGLDDLKDLSGLENANLNVLHVNDCPNLTDISALAGLRVSNIGLWGVDRLRDVSVLGNLPNITNISIWGAQLSNLDFLRELPNKNNLSLGLGSVPANCGGLEAIGSFESLEIGDNYAAAAPYLQNKPVRNLTIYNENGLDLSTLPEINGELFLSNCGIRDLNGLGARRIRKLSLDNCQYLRSLAGMEGLEQMNQLEVRGCPRLTDWSPLEGRTFKELILRGTYSLPDFGKLTFLSLTLESTVELTDLSCLDEVNDGNRYTFSFRGLDQVTSLQPLFRLRGDALEVPPQLQEQAAELVESGRFKSWSVVYPDGSWEPDTGDVTLLGWDELDELPKSVLRRVRTLTLVGDVLVNDDTTELNETWTDEGPLVTLRDRETGEETVVTQAGTTLTDLSRLSRLTGLENLALWYQPLTNLDGIQALDTLRNLEVKYSPDFTDASAAFTVQTLERLCFSHTGLASLQGVQNLPYLKELYIDDTRVRDFSPLTGCSEELYLVYDLPELMTLDELKAMPAFLLDRIDSIAVAGDWAYRQWDPWWMGNEDQGDGKLVPTLFKNGSDEKMAVEMGHITDLAELSFLPNLRELKLYRQPITDLSGAAALKKLESIDIGYCDELTDPSPLFALEDLRDVNLNDTRAASIEGIEQMKRLTSLAVAYCEVTDMSPLEKVDYAYCMQEENGGGFSLEVMKPREDPVFTAADYAPLAAIPAFDRLDVSWVPAALWLDAVKDAPVKQLNAQCGTFTSNGELQAFVAAHPGLEEIQITFCSDLTDISCLLGLERLRYVEVSDNMTEAIASLGEGYGFELNVRPW